jgi:two-component system, chemotaxis family, sensor kinase CheA
MDLAKYEKIFTQESERYLEELETLLMQVEKDLGNRDLWSEIHGKIHSIKGMARALSLDGITDLTHSMEDWAKGFQQGSREAVPSAVQLLFECADLLRVLVARKGEIDSYETQGRYSSLYAHLKDGPKLGTDDIHLEIPPPSPSTPEGIHQIRVNYSLIEELLGLSQEILISEKTLPILPQEKLAPRLKNWLVHYRSLVKGLYFRLAQLRLMSVADFAELFVKTIRGLAKGYDKDVRLEVIGGEVLADIALLDRLREPVMHLLRNAVAHGIESPEERMSAGKDPEGAITLEARRERDSLIIVIKDDGRGIDQSSIAGHLRDTRSMTNEQIQGMAQEDFFNTILSPDFSSSPETTDVAGRGIGMSVVCQSIAYLGGSMTIRSEPSKGADFSIRLPLSLSIIHAVTFEIGKYTLSIPTSSVESIYRKKQSSPTNSNSFYDLRDLLGVNNGGEPLYTLKIGNLAEKNSHNRSNGEAEMAVDRVIGNRPLMVLPVGELLAKAGIFAGVGIMENGDISMLLDLENLLEM